jgi:hypothetical protein
MNFYPNPDGPALLHITIDKDVCLKNTHEIDYNKIGWQNRVKSVSHPTEPANYRGSNTTRWKEILDIEIAMHRNTGIQTKHTITTILPETGVKSMIEKLLKLTVCEQGGLGN